MVAVVVVRRWSGDDGVLVKTVALVAIAAVVGQWGGGGSDVVVVVVVAVTVVVVVVVEGSGRGRGRGGWW